MRGWRRMRSAERRSRVWRCRRRFAARGRRGGRGWGGGWGSSQPLHHAIDLAVGERSGGAARAARGLLAPGGEVAGGLLAAALELEKIGHFGCGDDERGGAAVARDGDGFALSGIEQLAETILRAGRGHGCHRKPPGYLIIAILFILASLAILVKSLVTRTMAGAKAQTVKCAFVARLK